MPPGFQAETSVSLVRRMMPTMDSFTIVPTGTYSLRESAEFGFGGRSAERYVGVMRMAFCLDGYRSQVGVELRQDKAGVHGIVPRRSPNRSTRGESPSGKGAFA